MKEYKYTSHESFDHGTFESLGYDWERVSDPNMQPKFPVKIYLPRSTEHVVSAVKESIKLGQTLKIRSKGHSSNDLVLEADGVVLCTEMLNKILSIDESMQLVRLQSGAVLAEVDEELSKRNLGLRIIGDHNHITAGGFASVGGISPASHRFGLFIDNIMELTFVNWKGETIICSPNRHPELFNKVLAGTGRFGVITELLVQVYPVKKFKTIVRNNRLLFSKVENFIAKSQELICDPGACEFERGVWVDYPLGWVPFRVGQFSSYFPTSQSLLARLRRRLAYGYLHTLGYWAGRLPNLIDRIVKFAGLIGIIFSPRYATIKDVECFTDKVLDSSVGDPTRMLIVLAPIEAYSELFRKMYSICLEAREKHGAITFISFYVKAIHSNYLAKVDKSGKFSELMLYLGVNHDKMTTAILDDIVERLDTLCVQHRALRYMHSKSSKKPEVLAKVDPNRYYPEP